MYQENEVSEKNDKVLSVSCGENLMEHNKANRIALVLAYKRNLPYKKDVITRNRNILCLNQYFQHIFNKLILVAYRINKNVHNLLRSKNVVNGKPEQTNSKSKKTGYSSPCLTKSGNLCCKQAYQTTIFASRNNN